MAGDSWLFTKGGQEFANTFRRIAQALETLIEQDKEEKSTLITTKDIFFKQRVAERAWDLFRREIAAAEIISPWDEEHQKPERPFSVGQAKHYAEQSYQLATLFTAYVDGK